jgi:hypothetical protein
MALVPRAVRTSVSAALAALAFAGSARAADPFEIQVYDGTANEPGEAGLELHSNYVANGLRTMDGTALPAHHVAHFTLEPSYGVLPWWEIGGYFQTALRPEGSLDYAGVKLRSKFVTPRAWSEEQGGWRFGVNLELSILPDTYDPDRIGSEVRPIVAWEDERWAFALNPIVSVPLAGEGSKHGPQLEPAASGMVKLGRVGAGLEYYSSLGPFSDFAPVNDQEHYLYEVVNVLGVEHLEVNVGLGEGLSGGSNKVVVKSIVGYSF